TIRYYSNTNSVRNSATLPHQYIKFNHNHTTTTYIYTLSLHDALPIYAVLLATAEGLQGVADGCTNSEFAIQMAVRAQAVRDVHTDRKSTRLNSSHVKISYAVFCLKKKKIKL